MSDVVWITDGYDARYSWHGANDIEGITAKQQGVSLEVLPHLAHHKNCRLLQQRRQFLWAKPTKAPRRPSTEASGSFNYLAKSMT
ncbi:MAG: hypothetical protein ACYDHC_13305, partial [Desulfuromonadaceae bacterium]